MADTYITTRSNYFKPTNVQNCTDFILTSTGLKVWKKRNDPSWIAFGGDQDIEVTDAYMEEYLKGHPSECDDAMDIFVKQLQTFLPENEIVAIQTIAHEKLKYVTGHTTVITKNYTESNSMHYQLERQIRERFNRPDFVLDDEY